MVSCRPDRIIALLMKKINCGEKSHAADDGAAIEAQCN